MPPLISTLFLSTAIRVVIGGLFVYAGVLKMLDPWGFAFAIDSFQMVPRALISPLAIVLPPLEVLAGILWVLDRAPVTAATAIFGLCVVFALALGAAIFRGLPTQCGCFGAVLGGSSPGVALVRDLFFVTATGYWLGVAKTRTLRQRA